MVVENGQAPGEVGRMEMDLQHPSDGIIYEGYDGGYITCRYAQDEVYGKDELYIFRCSADKQCCGRECCIPAAAAWVIPPWLLALLIILGILLALLLALILYLCLKYCCRKKAAPPPMYKPVPPPVAHPNEIHHSAWLQKQNESEALLGRRSNQRMTVLTDLDEDVSSEDHSTNKIKNKRKVPRLGSLRRPLHARPLFHEDAVISGSTEPHSSDISSINNKDVSRTSSLDHYRPGLVFIPSNREIMKIRAKPVFIPEPVVEKPVFMPSPMSETYLPPPHPIVVSSHDETEFTQQQRPLLSRPDSPEPEKAKIIHYRPFVADPLEETTIAPPERSVGELHHTSEWTSAQKAAYSTVDGGEPKQPQLMYCRPGHDDVAAY